MITEAYIKIDADFFDHDSGIGWHVYTNDTGSLNIQYLEIDEDGIWQNSDKDDVEVPEDVQQKIIKIINLFKD